MVNAALDAAGANHAGSGPADNLPNAEFKYNSLFCDEWHMIDFYE